MPSLKSNSISNLTEQLSSIYNNDATLNSLKRYEEDRKSLLGIDLESLSFRDSRIEKIILDMKEVIESKNIQDAFKTYSDYESYAKPILSSLEDNNYKSFQEEIKRAAGPWLANDYKQTMNATSIFNETIKNVADMDVLHDTENYSENLAETMVLFNDHDNMLSASKSLIKLASMIENDAFITTLGLNDKEPFESDITGPQDSPMYKQTEELIDKSEQQITLLENMSKHMASQTVNLKYQNDITSDQIEANENSSRSAFNTAVISIVIVIVFSVFGIGLTYYVFQEEAKSDNKNHKEVRILLEDDNKVLTKLVVQLKEQNKNILTTNKELIKQNGYFKELIKRRTE